MRWAMFFPVLLSLVSVGVALAAEDIEGSKDHPLVTRYPGSYIYYYEEKEFDEFPILLGPVRSAADRDIQEARREELTGKVIKIQYQVPKERSPFEVFKNYEEALQKSNIHLLYSGRGGEVAGIRRFLSPYFSNVYASRDDEKNFFYLSAKDETGNVAISICVLPGFDGPIVLLGIVEKRPMESGRITVKDILTKVQEEGHVAIYGIYFDFDKADVKPESKPALDAIAEFLRMYPEAKFYVVGHTDSTGRLEYNLELSKRRAEAVVRELVEKYGIEEERLKSFGVGPLAPVASNATEEGRVRNRRVELVPAEE